MILKAGTYRFNDVPELHSLFVEYQNETLIPFTFTIDSTLFSCNGFTFAFELHSTTEISYFMKYIVDGVGEVVVLSQDYELAETGADYGEVVSNLWAYSDMALITITADTEVDDTFGSWYISNTNYNEVNAKPLAEITYNGETIAQLNAGETATLKCGPTEDTEYKMASDVVIKTNSEYKIPKLTSGSAIPDTLACIVYPPEGYDGYSKFVVGPIPDGYVKPEGDVTLTSNGSHDVSGKKTAIVDVQCAEPHVIPVDALPITDIDKTAVYEYDGKLYRYEPDLSDSLVGTWVFNYNISYSGISSYTTFYIDFTCPDDSSYPDRVYTGIQFLASGASFLQRYLYSGGYVQSGDLGHFSSIYRTIVISGGSDITDDAFITWLKANATLQEGSSYKWVEYLAPTGTLELTLNNIEAEFPIDCSKYANVTVKTAEPLIISDPNVLDNITDSPWGVGGSVFLYEGTSTDTYENGTLYYLEDTEK